MMSLAVLEKRLRKVAITFLSVTNGCCCRRGRKTNYHIAAELEKIMNVRCPIHQFRDLGDICWVPTGSPLLPQDRNLCACPPSLTRDVLAGNRSFLTQQQQEDECGKWRDEFTQKAHQDFRIEQLRVAALVRKYLRDTRSGHGNSPRQN
jgi:hypothetical protein